MANIREETEYLYSTAHVVQFSIYDDSEISEDYEKAWTRRMVRLMKKCGAQCIARRQYMLGRWVFSSGVGGVSPNLYDTHTNQNGLSDPNFWGYVSHVA